MSPLPILKPDLQIAFFYRLQTIRSLFLSEALKKVVAESDLTRIDKQLSQFVKKGALSKVASFGLRGEVVFPVPAILKANPFLLGYYRLLYGLSQKEFYKSFSRFKKLEEKGTIVSDPDLKALCMSMCKTGELLVDGIDQLSVGIVQDLQLLTFGAQLRGGKLNALGANANQEVFALIREIAHPSIVEESDKSI